MKQRRTESFITILLSLACLVVFVISTVLGWEFWVPPLIVIGAVLLWIMNIYEKPEYGMRKMVYFLYASLLVFFHGIHVTSFNDSAVFVALMMVAMSFFNHVYMMNLLFAEYLIVLAIQLFLGSKNGFIILNKMNDSRIALYLMGVIFVFFSCVKIINDRQESEESEERKDERIERYDADMEDFLSNVSHELRTPVNVVNGMSDIMIKRDALKEAYSIKEAGIRLAYQIEDIQDYTECKRQKLILEEDEYLSISLINDVVTDFRLVENTNNLVLVVDISPDVPSKLRGDSRKLHKIMRHLLENAVKFTKTGGIYVKMYTEKADYGVNLCVEITDTGIGMDRKEIESISEGMYQVNKRRDRSSGGIGLGLYIVYGFAHKMEGFVKIESEKGFGTTLRVTIPQEIADESPCLALSKGYSGDIIFHVNSRKYKVPRILDFYRSMAANLAAGLHVPLYPAESIKEIERLIERLNVAFIFMGQEEYEDNPDYFDRLSKGDIVVAVSAYPDFKPRAGSNVIIMPKPLYAYPVIRILNEGRNAGSIEFSDNKEKFVLNGVKALIVDDEPMNLVVASGLFSDYEMSIETAGSGKEAVQKFRKGDFNVVFMDHMMPEMDGVEAMKRIKKEASDENRSVAVIALTANAVSGAKEMFMEEGFDGFIAKPIDIGEFERVMKNIINAGKLLYEGRNRL